MYRYIYLCLVYFEATCRFNACCWNMFIPAGWLQGGVQSILLRKLPWGIQAGVWGGQADICEQLRCRVQPSRGDQARCVQQDHGDQAPEGRSSAGLSVQQDHGDQAPEELAAGGERRSFNSREYHPWVLRIRLLQAVNWKTRLQFHWIMISSCDIGTLRKFLSLWWWY